MKRFLKTNEAKQIAWLDYCGYHLTTLQRDLTPLQAIFITRARLDLYKEMNSVEDSKKAKRYTRDTMDYADGNIDSRYGIPIRKK